MMNSEFGGRFSARIRPSLRDIYFPNNRDPRLLRPTSLARIAARRSASERELSRRARSYGAAVADTALDSEIGVIPQSYLKCMYFRDNFIAFSEYVLLDVGGHSRREPIFCPNAMEHFLRRGPYFLPDSPALELAKEVGGWLHLGLQ